MDVIVKNTVTAMYKIMFNEGENLRCDFMKNCYIYDKWLFVFKKIDRRAILIQGYTF